MSAVAAVATGCGCDWSNNRFLSKLSLKVLPFKNVCCEKKSNFIFGKNQFVFAVVKET
jgi:hypothetical protein